MKTPSAPASDCSVSEAEATNAPSGVGAILSHLETARLAVCYAERATGKEREYLEKNAVSHLQAAAHKLERRRLTR